MNLKKEVNEKLKEIYKILNKNGYLICNEYNEFIGDNNLENHLVKFYRQLEEMKKEYNLED